jgi:hypothetical protein
MFHKSPQVRRIFDEAAALSAVLQCVEGQGDPAEAISLVEKVAVPKPTDNAGRLVQAAMAFVLQKPVSTELAPGDGLDESIFEAIGRAWIAWATSTGQDQAQKALATIPAPRGPQPEGGALHLMAMQPWAQAVSALLQDDLAEARRFFRRATELSSQCGTETNSAIQWTYAASYFGR